MATNAPKKVMSLLDALDQSFMSTDSPTPALPTQTPDSHLFPEAGPSSSAALDALRAAQSAYEISVAAAAPFMTQSLASLGNAGRGGGFKLNYDVETPLRAIDVGGPDQEQRLADFVTKSIENTGQNVSVKDAMKKLGLKDNRDLLPGVEVRLLSHQAIGVAWMLDKERSPDRGGILA
ncbi:unnamed protein product [Cyclocybe aegerita]|uniref:Uncharacterized protein n=1 Tax=Cyclocybe aegerita TaxID=1973307 RepID=A0A8S0WZG6_CYCAE|nr:unnamed protein product [Cyclocybe aegerita]